MSSTNQFDTSSQLSLILDILGHYKVSKREEILELGSGDSPIMELLCGEGYRISGVDFDKLIVSARDDVIYADIRHLEDYVGQGVYRIMTGLSILSIEAQMGLTLWGTKKRIDGMLKGIHSALPQGGLFFNIEFPAEAIGYSQRKANDLDFKVLQYQSKPFEKGFNYTVLQKI
mgnify:CR=1 FL=1|jgi:hypothetical protein